MWVSSASNVVGVVVGGEVAPLASPAGDRARDAADHLPDRVLARGRAELAAEILLGDDVGRVLGPSLRELDVALLERDLVAVADARVPQLPLDRVERVLAGRREEAPDREALARPYPVFELGLRDLIHTDTAPLVFPRFPLLLRGFLTAERAANESGGPGRKNLGRIQNVVRSSLRSLNFTRSRAPLRSSAGPPAPCRTRSFWLHPARHELGRSTGQGAPMKLLVTGGAGYIGSIVARQLLLRRPRGDGARQPRARPSGGGAGGRRAWSSRTCSTARRSTPHCAPASTACCTSRPSRSWPSPSATPSATTGPTSAGR